MPTHLACCALSLAIVFIAGPAKAGAWVPEPGSGYHKLSGNAFESRSFFGGRAGFESFTDRNLTYYGEVGVIPRVALFGSLPLKRLRQVDAGQRADSTHFGDADIGLRLNWLQEPLVISTSTLVKLPYLYDEDDPLPPGNGQEDLEARLLLGKSLGKLGYFGIEAGYRFRVDEPADEYRYLIEYGISFGDHLYMRSKLDGIESAENASAASSAANLAINPEFDLGKLELTAGWNFGAPPSETAHGRVGLEFTYTRDLYGSNTLRGDAFSLGIVFVH